MKLRTCAPVSVPGTVAHALQAAASYFVYRIEFELSLLMTKSQIPEAVDAPNTPEAGLCDWPDSKRGGDGIGKLPVVLKRANFLAAYRHIQRVFCGQGVPDLHAGLTGFH